jgi:hypothetical protein
MHSKVQSQAERQMHWEPFQKVVQPRGDAILDLLTDPNLLWISLETLGRVDQLVLILHIKMKLMGCHSSDYI